MRDALDETVGEVCGTGFEDAQRLHHLICTIHDKLLAAQQQLQGRGDLIAR
ncbi:MAG: hypothetical protein H0U56_01405, partial [Methylibium sp.]|nr:hypothetical protein [Methylibium sp.]